MVARSNKAKQYGLIALKVLLLSLTFGYIYLKMTNEEAISFSQFLKTLQSKSIAPILVFMVLAASNWFFEILKWQTVVRGIKNISLTEATKQTLCALTVSLATPNRIGEYGVKAFYYPPQERRQILLRNLLSNTVQMLITVVFGIIGLLSISKIIIFDLSFTKLLLLVLAIFILTFLAYKFKEKELLLKGLSISKILAYFKALPTIIKWKLLVFSLIRYLIFSILFYFLLKFYNAKIDLEQAAPLIFVMYFFSSVVPTLFVFDVIIKGGIAVWLFTQLGVAQWPVLCTVLSMWILNFVFPAIWGSFYVVTYKRTS